MGKLSLRSLLKGVAESKRWKESARRGWGWGGSKYRVGILEGKVRMRENCEYNEWKFFCVLKWNKKIGICILEGV